MNKKKLAKIGAILVCLVLIVVLTVTATVAYLSSEDTVVNTFTMGNVKISLDESAIKHDGDNWVSDTAKPRVKANEYKLIPGCTYAKDPTVTVQAKSEPCYVRAIVTITKGTELNNVLAAHTNDKGEPLTVKDMFVGRDAETWKGDAVVNNNDDTITYELRYKDVVTAGDSGVVLTPIFTQISMPGAITEAEIETLDGMKVTVVAQAIQSAGFADANTAWTAWVAPVTPTAGT